MKRNRIFKRGLASLLAFALVFVMGVIPASASESATTETTFSGFYLLTTTVPEDATSYAVNNVSRFLLARSEIDNFDLNSVTMGTPFTIGKENTADTDVYYFPIISNNQVIYTFRVYVSGNEYTGILSPYMAEQLNDYMNATTPSDPLHIYMESGKVMAALSDSVEILEESHAGYEPSLNIVTASVDYTDLEVTNILTNIAFVESPVTIASASKDLTLDMKEQQGSQQWCAAFAMAAILRYKGSSSVTAEGIVKYFYPKSSDLENESVSRDQLETYAKSLGYSNTTQSSSTLSNSTVVSEIGSNSTPIYAGCAGSGSYSKARHALVICGYNNTSSTYTVWNPWYTYTETMDQSTKTYIVNSSSSFTWDCTIYKVRK